MVKKYLLLAIFLFVAAGCQYFRSTTDPLYNILEQGVKEFDAKGGKIFITNAQTKQIYKIYSVGKCAFTPFNLQENRNCIIKLCQRLCFLDMINVSIMKRIIFNN